MTKLEVLTVARDELNAIIDSMKSAIDVPGLTPIEHKLFVCLLGALGQPVSIDSLMDSLAAKRKKAMSMNSFYVHMSRLRYKAVEKHYWIERVSGGYVMQGMGK